MRPQTLFKGILLLILLSCPGAVLLGQQHSFGGSFLEIPLGAKALGLGGAYTALAADGTAFFWNPAGIALVENMTLSGMYSSQFGKIGAPLANYYFAGWTMPVQMLKVSVNWIRFAVTDIPYYADFTQLQTAAERWQRIQELNGDPASFNDNEDAFSFGFAYDFKFNAKFGWSYPNFPFEVPVGINLKIVHQNIAGHTASGIGVDAGVMFRMNLKDIARSDDWPLISVGFAMKDIGNTSLIWDTSIPDEGIQGTTSFGMAVVQPLKTLDSRLSLAYDMSSIRNGENRLGLEVQYHKRYSFRLGLNNGSLALGAGVNFYYFEADYAYLAPSEKQLGDVHRLTLSFNFDKLLERNSTEGQ